MGTAAEIITARVRDRVREEFGEPGRRGGAGRIAREEVRRYNERALNDTTPLIDDEHGMTSEVLAAVTGFGAIQPLLDDPGVEEIWINEPTKVFVARGGVSELTDVVLGEGDVRDLVERMLRATGRRVDLANPFVDASLPDGSRLHVVIPDVTRRHMSINIRKFSARIRDLGQLVAAGSISYQAAEFLRASMTAGANLLVSGATQAGKTTMLGALIASLDPALRIVTVEETFELAPGNRDVVAMQCRQASLEGTGEITLRRLIKEALRMRPDRIVVGEVREAESLDLLIALNSGLPESQLGAPEGRKPPVVNWVSMMITYPPLPPLTATDPDGPFGNVAERSDRLNGFTLASRVCICGADMEHDEDGYLCAVFSCGARDY